MKLKPLFDRVLLKPLEALAKKGPLYIPDTAKEKPQKGEVVAVGPGKKDDDGNLVKPGVKVGDKVLFEKYSGTEVKLDGEDHVVVRADDIVATLTK